MAQFRGTVAGTRGDASRLGSKSSGLCVTADGWNVGVTVYLTHEDGRDVVRIHKTSGSNGRGQSELIAEFSQDA
jgi:hypothetical protein